MGPRKRKQSTSICSRRVGMPASALQSGRSRGATQVGWAGGGARFCESTAGLPASLAAKTTHCLRIISTTTGSRICQHGKSPCGSCCARGLADCHSATTSDTSVCCVDMVARRSLSIQAQAAGTPQHS
eukprot:7354744-Alexandrium_andersonii.AAC.1